MKQNETSRISTLTQKKYDVSFIKEAEKELKIIQKFLDSYYERISGILSDFPQDIKSNLDVVDMSDEDYALCWQQVSFVPKPMGNDVAYHITLKGERVRSKSEEIIANALFSKGIPYRYECPVKLKNGYVVHPDFTILDIRNRREVFLEHLGKMDDPEYVNGKNGNNGNMWKFREYERSGINLGKNLLVTYESSKDPLNSRIVEEFIKTHFGK